MAKKYIFITAFLILFTFSSAQGADTFRERARVFRDRGYAAQMRGDLDAALENYQQALTVDGSYAAVYNDLGVIYEAEGYLDKAREYYLKCVEKDPNYQSAYSNLALVYEESEDWEKAREYWAERVQLGSPDDFWTRKAQQHLEDIQAKLGSSSADQKDVHVGQAWGQARMEIEDAPVTVEGWTATVKKDSAVIVAGGDELSDNLLPAGEYVDSEIYRLKNMINDLQTLSSRRETENCALQEKVISFTEALAQERTQSKTTADKNTEEKVHLKNMINDLQTLSSQRETENRTLQEKVISFAGALAQERTQSKTTADKNTEEKAHLYETLGTAYIKAKFYNEAIEVYKQSLALNSNNARLYYYLGLLYQYKRKDSKKAVECFREYVELEPYGDYSEKVEDLIKILK